MKPVGDVIGTVGWRVGIGCGQGLHDLRVRSGDIVGGKVWVGAGCLESSRSPHTSIVSLTSIRAAWATRGPESPWYTAKCKPICRFGCAGEYPTPASVGHATPGSRER